jgi:hypothetical protein
MSEPTELQTDVFSIELYDVGVVFGVGGTQEAFAREFCRLLNYGDDDTRETVGHAKEGTEREVPPVGVAFSSRTSGDAGLWMPKKPDCVSEIGTVAHEAAHITFHIALRKGIEYTTHGGRLGWVNDEAFTYLIGHITRGYLRFINRTIEAAEEASYVLDIPSPS